VAAAISLFGFESGAALATVVGVLIEVPVMLLVVKVVNASKGWYEAARRVDGLSSTPTSAAPPASARWPGWKAQKALYAVPRRASSIRAAPPRARRAPRSPSLREAERTRAELAALGVSNLHLMR
jgi:hypothetical protein